ncbi:UNVERIFIED_CONTAM: hypothetical protein Slati_3743800 [Sesamum latifolium]|uniref:Aminotransferase-like plant mobile domain-containing protein n=1 Tax=Sesamum latifolium TaxID=2727402 RepID=A0AAW2U749_9LAMI
MGEVLVQESYKYHMPPPRKEKKTVWPKSTHNPLGDIATHKRWSTVEEALFDKLCIEGNLKEEAYLAAYLACWLCTFILPGKDVNSIRPSTFKIASMMASGRRVSLAIFVLANIYEGLNTSATSPRSARTSPSFPVHFVYAWLASYFKTHYPVWQGLHGPKMTRFFGEGGAKYYNPREAQKRIHKAEFVSWACDMIVKNKPFKFVDNGDAEELDHNYFIAIRSSYLTLHQGDKFIIDPYSPHRFEHQFGPKPLKITSKRKKHEDKQVDVGENNPSHAFVPSVVIRCKPQAVVAEANRGKEDEVQSIDASEESETNHSSTTTPPLGMGLKRKQLPRPPAVSVFEVGAYDEVKSLSSEKLSRNLQEQHLKEAKACLQDVQAKASEEASKVQYTMDELEHIEKEIVALKGQKQLNHDAQAKVHEVEEDIAALENTAPLDDAMVEDLESSKANLEDLKEDLKILNPFA